MEIHRLQLEHFRNYPHLDLTLGGGIHVLAGANAQGKTNVLEAVYFAATGRSPRATQEGSMITWGEEFSHVTGEFIGDRRGLFTVEIGLGRKPAAGGEERRRTTAQKRIKVNGVQRQLTDLAGLAPVVLFMVDDLEIIRGEPARRREFLDIELSAISRTYQWALRQYTRVLEQRNRLLKDIRERLAGVHDLAPWTAQLASFGGRVLEVRTCFVGDLNAVSGETYGGLTQSAQAMTIEYRREWGEPSDDSTREFFADQIEKSCEALLDEEIQRGSSLVGPHRDDLLFLIDGKDVRHFGSQGEQRTAALTLRVAEFTLLQKMIGEPPVLLLDDILSELDRTRRAALLGHLAPITQVILTTTDADAVTLPERAQVFRYHIEGGAVTPIT